MKKLLFFACALFLTISLAAQKTDLKYDLQVGKEYAMTLNMNMLISQDAMGMSTDITSDMNYEMSYKVKSFDAGIYDIEIAYKSIVMEMSSPYGNTKYDSESQANDAVTKMYRNMKTASFGMKMDRKGEVAEVYGLDEMLEKIVSDQSFSAQEKALIREQFQASFGEESFKNNMIINLAFPKDPVGAGDKWESGTTVTSNGIRLSTNTEYEYAGISDGMWVIRGTSTITTPAGTKMSAQGMDMDVDMKGTMTTEMKFDPETGWVSAGNAEQDVNGNVSMDVPMQGRMDMVMKMVTKAAMSGK